MHTFEEWLVHLGIDLNNLDKDKLAFLREQYRKACERVKLQKHWAPKAGGKPNDRTYAVTVRDGSNLWLALWVKRSASGNYYVMLPAPLPDRSIWNPHVSYHQGGQYHHKSHDHKMTNQKRQPPGLGFVGVENMLVTDLTLDRVRILNTQCDATQFDGVLEIPAEALRQGTHTVAVDLTETGGPTINHSGQIIRQKRFSEHVPEIVITVLQMPSWVKLA